MKLVADVRVEDHYLSCTSQSFALAKVGKSSKKYYSNDAFVSYDFYHGLPWYKEKFAQRLPGNEIQDSFFHREIGA